MSEIDKLYMKLTEKKPRDMNVSAEVEKIMSSARGHIQALADEYRETILLPLCRKLRLTYIAGMGRTVFYVEGDERRSFGDSHDVERAGAKYRPLLKVFRQLNVDGIGQNDAFGYYVAEITEADIE